MTPDETSSSGGSVLVTLGLVALAIVALSAVDTFLARTERQENHAEANGLAGHVRLSLLQLRPLLATEFHVRNTGRGGRSCARPSTACWCCSGRPTTICATTFRNRIFFI